MSVQDKVVSDDQKVDPSGDDTEVKQDQVSYDTHRKLLGEKKKLQTEFEKLNSKLKEVENAERERVEKELREKEDYKKLLELKDKELAEKAKVLQEIEEQKVNSMKLSSILKNLGGEVDNKYWIHFDLDKVVIDPATKAVDPLSVSKVVEEFKKTYPEIIKTPDKKAMPNNFPAGGSADITYDEWLRLPAKEMKARLKDVIKQ
jgi:predicted nuclease with TOPRIM domain